MASDTVLASLRASFARTMDSLRVGTYDVANVHEDRAFTCGECGVVKVIDAKHNLAVTLAAKHNLAVTLAAIASHTMEHAQ